MFSDNHIDDVISGVAKAVIELSFDRVREFANKFKNKELAFIQEKSVIELVREQYYSGESKFYGKYIEDKYLLLLVRLGLTLRKLESDKNRLNNLRDKIFSEYEVKGLHVCYFVQNGILNRYIGILIESIKSEDELKDKILFILNNIEKHILFVNSMDKSNLIIKRAMSITASHSPSVFIISGTGSASKLVKECSEKIVNFMNDYELEKVSGWDKEILFFKRKIPKTNKII